MALLCLVPIASAEIPHENYDLVGSNLDMVVQLLKQGINATELALGQCINERPADGLVYLTLLDDILVPVGVLITQIQHIATSYIYIRYLTPPFDNLSAGGHGFIENQSAFIDDRSALGSYVGRVLTPTEYATGLEILSDARQRIYSMNSHLDTMDHAADDIANLTVENKKPFNTSYLKELIDRLRMMMDDYLLQLGNLFLTINWGAPFLALVLDRTDYFLGETVYGSGYVSGGTGPATNVAVDVTKDSTPFATVATDSQGTFSFYWLIPIDAAQLGYHNFSAMAVADGTPVSDYQIIRVLKIPTSLSIQINGERFSPDENVVAYAFLRDYKGDQLSGMIVTFKLDSLHINKTTSISGRADWVFVAIDAGWGEHNISARYNGSDIYEPSQSAVSQFNVNIPTKLILQISANRVERGQNVTLVATLFANESETLPNRTIVITIDDGFLTSGSSVANGSVIYLLHTANLSTGTHILRAWFNSTDPMYAGNVSDPVNLIVFVESSNQGQNNQGQNNRDWWQRFWDWMTENIYWLILLFIVIIILAIVMLSTDTVKNAREMRAERKRQLVVKEEAATEISPSEEELKSAIAPSISKEKQGMDYSIFAPKMAIVKRYGALLDALRDERRIPIRPNLTAREIGRTLLNRNYPAAEVKTITAEFERAMYSADEMTREDWKSFERAAQAVQSHGGDAR